MHSFSSPDRFIAFAKDIEVIHFSSFWLDGGFISPMDTFDYMVPFLDFKKAAHDFNRQEVDAALAHQDPKVRSLGVLALHYQQDAEAIQLYYALLNDKGIGFKKYPFGLPNVIGGPRIKDRRPPAQQFAEAKRWTIGEMALQFLQWHYQASLYEDFPKHLERYIEERKGRTFTAGYLAVRMKQVSSGISPFPPSQKPHRAALIRELSEKTTETEHDLYVLLSSAQETSFFRLFPEEEAIAAGRRLGAANLTRILAFDPPTEDPDILCCKDPARYTPRYYRTCEWILARAHLFFDSSAVPFFTKRQQEMWNPSPTATITINAYWWMVGLALIDPKNEHTYFEKGLELCNNTFEKYYREHWSTFVDQAKR